MADPMILQTREADRRLLMKLQHRLLHTPVPPETPAGEQRSDAYPLVLALAPMAMAFLYLFLFSVFVLR